MPIRRATDRKYVAHAARPIKPWATENAWMLHHDPMTGFVNRYASLSKTEQWLKSAPDDNKNRIAMWISIDRFKKINESFGHSGADTLLIATAQRIMQFSSKENVLIRMGSADFVILLSETNLDRAEEFGIQLLSVLATPLPIDEILVHPSVSIGLAEALPGENPSSILERSDYAMLDAERRGGNQLEVAGRNHVVGRSGVQLAREELVIESALYHAIRTGGLDFHYQPIVGMDGNLVSVEALMRCHTDSGPLPPERFIPVAEKTGLILRLGEWGMLQGARFASHLSKSGLNSMVSINVSAAQLGSPNFIKTLHASMIVSDIPPECIELELTESMLMDKSTTIQDNIRGIKEAGVALAIDDFGTGFSCLAQLKDLPVTKLKFDSSFIRMLPQDDRTYAIIKSITVLAHDLGMSVVAEGVETVGQLEACAAAGIDATQGYYHSRPLTRSGLLLWELNRKTANG